MGWSYLLITGISRWWEVQMDDVRDAVILATENTAEFKISLVSSQQVPSSSGSPWWVYLSTCLMSFLDLAAARPSLADIFRCVLIINHFLNDLRKGVLSEAAPGNVPVLSWASLHLLNVPPPKSPRSWWMKNKSSSLKPFPPIWFWMTGATLVAGDWWQHLSPAAQAGFSAGCHSPRTFPLEIIPAGRAFGGMLSHICPAEHIWRGSTAPLLPCSLIREQQPGNTKPEIKKIPPQM